jgi:hypothetical protein
LRCGNMSVQSWGSNSTASTHPPSGVFDLELTKRWIWYHHKIALVCALPSAIQITSGKQTFYWLILLY